MSSVVTCTTGNDAKFWLAALDGMVSDKDWITFMKAEGLSATVDYPSPYFWRKLMECQGAVDRQRPCKMVPLSQEQHLPRMSADRDASLLNHHLPIRWPSY